MGRLTMLLAAVATLGGFSAGCGASHKQPQGVAQSVEVSSAAGSSVVAGEPNEVIVEVRIASPTPPDEQPPPMSLAVVIDASGSMEGEPIKAAKKAAISAIGQLRDEDYVSVIAFHSETEVILPLTLVDDLEPELPAHIAAVQARGTTALEGGLSAGLAELAKQAEETPIRRVLLLGDGVPNDPQASLAQAQTANAQDVTITSVGLGDDYDEVLMGELARATGGRFHDAATTEELASLFDEELRRMQTVRARGAQLELLTGPGVLVTEVIGHDYRPGGRLQVGDLSDGDERHYYVKLAVDSPTVGAPVELLDAVLHYEDSLRVSQKQRGFVGARALDPSAEPEHDHDILDRAAIADASKAVIDALALARAGSRPEAEAMLRAAAGRALTRLEGRQNPELRELADRMLGLADDLPLAEPTTAVSPPPHGAPVPKTSALPTPAAPESDEADGPDGLPGLVGIPPSEHAERNVRSMHEKALQNLIH